MLARIQVAGFASLTLALGACAAEDTGRSSAKLSEIDWTTQQSGQTTLGRVAIDYTGDQIKAIAFRENGTDAGRMDFTYASGGRVDKIDVTDAEGDPASYNWNYAGDRLSSIRWSVAEIVSAEQQFEYDDGNGGRPRRVTQTTTWIGSTPTDTVQTYSYDERGRLEEIASVAGSETHTSEIRYDDQSRIERYTEYDDSDLTDVDLSYDEQGRLSRVETDDDDRYEITYDADGLIEEILILSPGSGQTRTVRYSYTAGDVEGLTYNPDLPVPGLIDLRGVAFDQAAFTAFAPPLTLGDVPAVEISTCSHDVCEIGSALQSSCDECAAAVCAVDGFCCSSSWDSTCVGYVPSYCGFTC